MTYHSWFQSHGRKHQAILVKLQHLSEDEVIRYFRFENMVEEEPDFCPLYTDNKKCHNIETLNCYLCACPNFRFDDEGLEKADAQVLYSKCNIDSKDGGQYISEDAIHQDCSACLVPHQEAYIKKVFSRDWFDIMKAVAKK